MKKARRRALFAMALGMMMTANTILPAYADIAYLPDVTEEMAEPAFWSDRAEAPREVLADAEQIEAMNRAILQEDACRMTDLRNTVSYFKQEPFYTGLWRGAYETAAYLMKSPHYFEDGTLLTGTVLNRVLDNIGEAGSGTFGQVRYGICVRTTNMYSLPTAGVLTDEQGDVNFDDNQLTALHVGEPVVIRAFSKDGAFCLCDSESVTGGWILSEDVAVCKNKAEWREAWDFPREEAVVITEGKVYLEASNVSPDTSEVLLTMGTVLRKITAEDYEASSLGRALYHNMAVWLPVRQEDGSYARTPALISQHQGVSEGYLPLTAENIMKVAFSRLGDVYGWGSMLHSVDCSDYVRNIYKCFGLDLARNTTWQAAMPTWKYDVSSSGSEAKKAVLDTLPPGAILIFSGHEMLYLGHVDGKYYVIDSVSNMMDFDSESRLRVRSVVVNTLDVRRMNGLTWLESIHTMVVPWQEPAADGPIVPEEPQDVSGTIVLEEIGPEESAPETLEIPELTLDGPNAVSEALLRKELANPVCAAIRAGMNIHTRFCDEEFLHGEKGPEFQKYIVMHDTCSTGDGDSVADYWISAGNKIAAHFIVDKDGSIVQCLPLDQIGHHAGWGDDGNNEKYGVPEDGRDDLAGRAGSAVYSEYGMNSYSIGIEMQHLDPDDGVEEDEYTEEQLAAVDQVIAYIDAYYGSESEIICHKDWRSSNSDTAASFDGYLKNYQMIRKHTP